MTEKKFTEEGHLIKHKKDTCDHSAEKSMAETGSQSAMPECMKKVGVNVWEIPISYKNGMLVPARVYANDELINQMDKGVFDQVTNVASLPGIQQNAFCMPDGHWGYGFPIGGVAAFDPKEGGVISPGGIGFDINCLVRGSKILTKDGYTKPIEAFESDFDEIGSLGSDFDIQKAVHTSPVVSFGLDNKFTEKNAQLFMKKEHKGQVYKIKSKLGFEVEVTGEHPVLTQRGMVEAEKLMSSDKIVIVPFEGMDYELASDTILATKNNLNEFQIKELEKRGLWPLTSRNKHIGTLAKLFGFLLGDGSIYFNTDKHGQICAFGQPEDLELIRKDFESLGFSARIYSRERDHVIPTRYGNVEFSGMNHHLVVSSRSLANLFFALGYPMGKKTSTEYVVPLWIEKGVSWIQRAFLAGLFGAELSKPSTHTKTGFYCHTLSMNKNSHLLENARVFCIQIMKMLEGFDINCHELQVREDFVNKEGKTHRLKLLISAEEENLLRLYSKIGFEYNPKRQLLSHIAILYIKEKKRVTKLRNDVAVRIKLARKQGLSCIEAKKYFATESYINDRFVHRHYYEDVGYRIPLDFPSFDEFVLVKKKELEENGCLFDAIDSITQRFYEDWVYDFTIEETHNFVANSIVVSNCGMRLIRTNLHVSEVQPKIKELMQLLYKKVPAGVGLKGTLLLSQEEFDRVMVEGASFIVEKGLGWPEDVEHIESKGKIPGADPSKVSAKARKRGINQLGTLGSGNHYLEVQVADKENVVDAEAAAAFGVDKDGQVVVMVHCGSRGFGHQIGTDYLRMFVEETMPKYSITILDKELACAPFNSEEGQAYFAAMACGANMAFANRQVITHRIREAFSEIFGKTAREMEMFLVYDVAHNIAKVEKHVVDGVEKELVVHRKGSTRAFGPGRASELPEDYRKVGQPVILGGSMETGSYLLVGQDGSEATYGSTAHGAGRVMSRMKAKQLWKGDELQAKMEKDGIYVKGASMKGLAEEAGGAYKDVHAVVATLEEAGITKRVVMLRPIGNIKG